MIVDTVPGPTEISPRVSSQQYSVQPEVQVPAYSTHHEGGTSGWADLKREVTRLRREIGRYLRDTNSPNPPPPSYVSK